MEDPTMRQASEQKAQGSFVKHASGPENHSFRQIFDSANAWRKLWGNQIGPIAQKGLEGLHVLRGPRILLKEKLEGP